MTFDLKEVARAMRAQGEVRPQPVSGWSVDTRTQNAGDVYFALKGPNHDGHAFVEAALEKRAAAVVVQEDRSLTVAARIGAATVRERSLVVPDTLTALQDAGRWARDRWGGTVVGVTGSAGKTT